MGGGESCNFKGILARVGETVGWRLEREAWGGGGGGVWGGGGRGGGRGGVGWVVQGAQTPALRLKNINRHIPPQQEIKGRFLSKAR